MNPHPPITVWLLLTTCLVLPALGQEIIADKDVELQADADHTLLGDNQPAAQQSRVELAETGPLLVVNQPFFTEDPAGTCEFTNDLVREFCLANPTDISCAMFVTP
jgi:hypothetical protein